MCANDNMYFCMCIPRKKLTVFVLLFLVFLYDFILFGYFTSKNGQPAKITSTFSDLMTDRKVLFVLQRW